VEEPQPDTRSAPAAAKETSNAEIVLGARITRNLSSCQRCTRSDSTEYCCPSDHGQVWAGFREEAVRKTGPCLRFHSRKQAQRLDICAHEYEGFGPKECCASIRHLSEFRCWMPAHSGPATRNGYLVDLATVAGLLAGLLGDLAAAFPATFTFR